MKFKFIIMVLLVIVIAILACLMGPLIFNSYQNQKQESQLTITSNMTLYREENNFTIKLSDLNGNPIANEQVNIKILNESESKDYSAVTDSNGIAMLGLKDLEYGNYTVNCTFNGNGQFKPTNMIQRIDVIRKVIEAPTVVVINQTLNSSYNDSGSYANTYSTGNELVDQYRVSSNKSW